MSGNDEVDRSNQLNQNNVDVIVHSTPLAATTATTNGHDDKLSAQNENSKPVNGDANGASNKNPFRDPSSDSTPVRPVRAQQQSSAEKKSWVQFEADDDDDDLSEKVNCFPISSCFFCA